MKSEAEIRAYLADMEKSLNMPCSCTATGHGYECHVGGMMTKSAIVTLKWALGDDPKHEAIVKHLREGIEQYEAEKN